MEEPKKAGVEWKKGGVELPAGLHRLVMARAEALKPKGLGKPTWTVAALYALNLTDEAFAEAVFTVRDVLERPGGKLDDASEAVRRLVNRRFLRDAREVLAMVKRNLPEQESGPLHSQSEAG